MQLIGYFRSSAAYRVRIAANLKGVTLSHASRHLVKGEQRAPDFLAINPHGLLPALVTDDGAVLTQSLAIIEWLDETQTGARLLPDDPMGRARVRSLACDVACEIHPLNNLRVTGWLKSELAVSADDAQAWYAHWIAVGFEGLEARLARDAATGRFCHGDAPGLADCCLIPQVFNARRFGVDLSAFPAITRIDAAAAELDAFRDAAPGVQPDAF